MEVSFLMARELLGVTSVFEEVHLSCHCSLPFFTVTFCTVPHCSNIHLITCLSFSSGRFPMDHFCVSL